MMTSSSGKKNKLISNCPVCSGQLYVTHLKCSECQTELNGEFLANEFARLPQDKLEFLRTFLACRGNLKEVEAELSISYPTVRGRLDAMLESLNLDAHPAENPDAEDSEDVLEALSRGDINAEEAERKLRR